MTAVNTSLQTKYAGSNSSDSVWLWSTLPSLSHY